MIILLILCTNLLIASENLPVKFSKPIIYSEVDWSFKEVLTRIYKIANADPELSLELIVPAYGIAMQESSFDTLAWNKEEDAGGLMQIRTTKMLIEYNKLSGDNLSQEYRFYFAYSIKIFRVVQENYLGADRSNLSLICAIWNSGSRNTKNEMVKKYTASVINRIKEAGLDKLK